MKGKNVKILLALLLVLVLTLSSACSGRDEGEKPSADLNADNGADSGAVSDAEEPSEAEDTAIAEITIAETVLYEADGIKVTAVGYEDGWMGPEIGILVENESEKNVLVTTDLLSVNGYMMPYSSLYTEVAAGKKANDTLTLGSSELKQSGIETVADLQFYIKVSDADTWDVLEKSELITLSTSAAGLEQPVDDTGDVLYEGNGIRVVCKGLKQDIIWDGTLVFYMENNSGAPISVYAENVSVNGFMQNVSLWSDLRDGTRLIDGMSLWDLSDLGLESIDDVEAIEFNLRIVHADTWDEIATTDVITLSFQ